RSAPYNNMFILLALNFSVQLSVAHPPFWSYKKGSFPHRSSWNEPVDIFNEFYVVVDCTV
ncbi:hypothetical protein, partial [Paenibacillus larvae]|uniref:hypothetical protein n=1 Tax=Paenibacillus larvae TaxID=1464 RepID=UPI0023A9190C